jgi:uncharacterized protein GlcG (DUF336 family)
MARTQLAAIMAALAVAVGAAACGGGTAPGGSTTTPGSAQQDTDRPGERASEGCGSLPNADKLRQLLKDAPGKGEAGGIAGGRFSWAAIVNRKGELCALAVSSEPTATWPGSRGIAIAKASTANGFSSDTTPISTARLYTMAQPGHSLYGAANGNPFNAECAGAADDTEAAKGKVCGGTIVFGGGVPLYQGNTKVGGLGVSGDTSCTDHEMAKRVRDAAGLNPAAGATVDDILYTKADGPSVFAHPLCANTWRNGMKIGDEPPASGY